ncbi:hypothetical protein Agabi119p4_6552 [Agaricus bisporus var. burnettii]|uniref:Velvet domain-containing protein n=1 Tax=Agaricus bisporus var. burnettii TaxID=192524 RepID=A0A8H7CAQ4_AGABI|nr:hypothetical protein Agabi119p4_6552 [Agaricus bisporus var. burnettii]
MHYCDGNIASRSATPTKWRRKQTRFIYKIQNFPPVTIKPMKCSRHVPSSTPHAPCSLCRYTKRTSCSVSPCIKYASAWMHNMFTLHTQFSVGSSSPQSVPYGSASTSSPSSPSRSASVSEIHTHIPSFSRPTPRIQVASLLADPQTRSYHLEIVQEPQKTAEFGQSNLSRLPVTPPIIAQLTVRDPSGNSVVPEAELPFLIAHLSLFSEDGRIPLNMGSDIGCGSTPPILYGNLVSSVNQLEDPQGNLGLYFLFPDVSIRWRGRYQLGMTLTRISGFDPIGAVRLASQGTVLAEAKTRTFEVFTLNQYTAVPPTRLTQCFLRQGARMFTYMPLTS